LGGGYPAGRIIELSGREKSGKTTLVSLAMAQAQIDEPDKEIAIIDTEHTFNPEWASKLGVDVDRMFIAQPDTYAEKIYQMIEYLLSSGKYSIVALDSVAGLVPKDEFEEHNWDKESRVGCNSKNNSKAMRKLVNSGLLTKSGTTLMFINQLRDKIGGWSPTGTPTDTPGGRALKFAYSQQLEVSIGEFFATGTGDARVVHGQSAKVKVAKNKVAPPFRQATVDFYYETGMDRYSELVAAAKKINVFTGGAWLTFIDPRTGEKQLDATGNEIRFNGEKKAKDAIIEAVQAGDTELYARIFTMVNDIIRGAE
jgi:recombination protein RecA